MFNGREWLISIGCYDYRNRIYQPSLGRFLQMDPKGFEAGDMNLYRFVDDDPIDRTDPFGLDDIEISAELNRLGIQAAVNSRNDFFAHPERGSGSRGQVVQENLQTHHLSLQNKIVPGGEPIPVWKGRLGTNTTHVAGHYVIETYAPDWGNRIRGIGHAHHNLAGENAKIRDEIAKWSEIDYGRARGSAKTGTIGTPVWKALTGSNRVDRLTPQKTPGEPPRDTPLGTVGAQGARSAGGSNSSGLSAADVDATHQATGVPSLGAESTNFAPGRP